MPILPTAAVIAGNVSKYGVQLRCLPPFSCRSSTMEPAFGRFSAIRHPSGSLLFARLLEGGVMEVLFTDVAYRAKLFDKDNPAKLSIRGRTEPPSVQLIALLLAVPVTTGALRATDSSELLLQSAQKKRAILELQCKDQAGVELLISAELTQVPAKEILEEIHQSLFSAVVALEATVRDAGGEKNSNFLNDRQLSAPSLASVKDLLLPLTTQGQMAESQTVFRRAAAADAMTQGNRAFVISDTAARVRREILEQRRVRKEEEARKKKRQRELLREAKRRSELARARKEKSEPITKKRKKSLFAVDKARPPDTMSSVPSKLAAKVEEGTIDRLDSGGVKENTEGLPHATEKVPAGSEDKSASKAGTAMGENDLAPAPRKSPTRVKPPAPKKKKKRLRSLV